MMSSSMPLSPSVPAKMGLRSDRRQAPYTMTIRIRARIAPSPAVSLGVAMPP